MTPHRMASSCSLPAFVNTVPSLSVLERWTPAKKGSVCSTCDREYLLPRHFPKGFSYLGCTNARRTLFSFSKVPWKVQKPKFSKNAWADPMQLKAEVPVPAVKEGAINPALLKAPLEIVLYPDPRLRAPNAPITVFDDNLVTFARRMFDAMYRTQGVGLAAPQVGVNLQMLVYNPEGKPDAGEEVVLINPRLVTVAKKKDEETEGCLSFPEVRVDVVRPVGVKIEAQDLSGKPFKLQLGGWRARIFQHEFDHLSGTLFIDRMQGKDVEQNTEPLQRLEAQYATLVASR